MESQTFFIEENVCILYKLNSIYFSDYVKKHLRGNKKAQLNNSMPVR